MTKLRCVSVSASLLLLGFFVGAAGQNQAAPPQPIVPHAIVLHAARLLDVKSGRVVRPGEVLVQGERIVEAGSSVKHPAGAEVIDLGDRTLLPGLIDAHVHLFLHPGAEDLQTVQESVPQRTILAAAGGQGRLDGGIHRRARHGNRRRGLGRYGGAQRDRCRG